MSCSTAFSQQNCDDIKEELEKEIAYYKETLKLLNSKIVVEEDGFIVKINSVTGKSDTGTITIEGLVENQGVIRPFRADSYKTLIIDPRGNNYNAVKFQFGNINYVKEFQKNLPLKFTITINKIGEEMPIISNLAIIFTNAIGKEYPKMIFKNLQVDWK